MQSETKILPIILFDAQGHYDTLGLSDEKAETLHKSSTNWTAIQQTAARFENDMFHPPVFICQAAEATRIEKEMNEAEMSIGGIIIEPKDQGTTASVAIAAHFAKRYDPDAMVLLTLAEYSIAKPKAFLRHIAAATPVVKDGYIVTFGALSDAGETRHGHIHKGSLLRPGTFSVEQFFENPKLDYDETALNDACYYQNSGMYLAHSDSFLDEIETFEPDLSRSAKRAFEAAKLNQSMMVLSAKYYRDCTSISFDRAIMERTKRAAMIPANIGWADKGAPVGKTDVYKSQKRLALL